MEMKAFSLASSIFNSIQSIDRSFWYRVPENSISNSISSSSISRSIELIWYRGNIPCFLLLPHLLGKQVQIALYCFDFAELSRLIYARASLSLPWPVCGYGWRILPRGGYRSPDRAGEGLILALISSAVSVKAATRISDIMWCPIFLARSVLALTSFMRPLHINLSPIWQVPLMSIHMSARFMTIFKNIRNSSLGYFHSAPIKVKK